MSISVLVLVILILLVLTCILLPYNKLKILFFTFTPLSLIVLVVWLLDRFAFNYQLSYGIGGALKQMLGSLLDSFDVTTRGLYTNVFALFVLAIFLLLSLFFLIINFSIILGKAPYVYNGTKVLFRVSYSLILIVSLSFATFLFFASLRNLFVFKEGFFDGLFELLVPYKGALA